MRRAITSTSLLMLGLTAANANAHPGHGIGGGSHDLLHYVTEPQHLGLLALLALVTTLGIMALRRTRALQPARIRRDAPRRRRTS